jgi:phage-related protein
MSVGTTFKLGFDGMSVNRGLQGLSKKVGSFSREIGIGAMRQVGARMTDLMGRIVMAIPDAVNDLTDWTGNLNDMAAQTQLSVSELVLLEEKLRLAGAEAADTSMIISRLSKNLHDASTEGGAAKDALNKLGFFADEFVDVPIDRAFEMIGKRVAELGPEFKGLEGVMTDLFGARMGYKLIRFFRDFEMHSSLAEKNIGKFADFMGGSAALKIDKFGEGMERITTLRRQMTSIFMDELLRGPGGSDFSNNIFDALDPEKLRPKIQALVSSLGRNF